MKHKQLTPFQKALVESVLDEYTDIPAEAEIEHTFSRNFMQWVYKMMRKSNKTIWHYTNTPLKKFILILLMIGLMTISAMAVPAIREAVIEFFVEKQSTAAYGITFDKEKATTAPKEIETYRKPQVAMEGFDRVIDEYGPALGMSAWINKNNEYIKYTQRLIPQDATDASWIGINAEGTTRKSLYMDGYQIEIFYMEYVYIMYWTDSEYLYSVEMSNSIQFEVFENILRSVM